MKKLIGLCVLALAVAMTAAAYAEVQSVKVSGDINIKGVVRENYDLKDEMKSNQNVYYGDDDSFYMTTTRVQVDADLTDNVSTKVRILNERDWTNDAGNSNSSSAIGIDLSSITFKELFYSPLSVTAGRQEIHLGNDLIVGDFDGVANSNTGLKAADLSASKSTDAIKAVLDLEPWTITALTAKMIEGTTTGAETDRDLNGINVGYKMADYSLELEGYLFAMIDNTATTYTVRNSANTVTSGRQYEERDIYTIGLRGSAAPIEGLSVGAEVAKQFGEMRDKSVGTGTILGEPNTTLDRDAAGMAIQASVDYDIPELPYATSVGLEYTYLSGEEKGNGGDYDNWIPIAENQVLGSIVEGLTNTYFDANYNAVGITNIQAVNLRGSIKPLENLTVAADWYHYWLVEDPTALTYTENGNMGRKSDDEFGDEVDVNVTYDYTEDVAFGLLGAAFLPGDTFLTQNDDSAYEVVGSVNVSF